MKTKSPSIHQIVALMVVCIGLSLVVSGENASLAQAPSIHREADSQTVAPKVFDEEPSLFFPLDAATVARLEAEAAPADTIQNKLGFRPLLQWRHWANQPKPFGKSILFILFYSLVAWSVAPTLLHSARRVCRQQFWSSLGIGTLVLAVGLTAVRTSVLTGLGNPLAILLSGMIELALLCGLAVSSSMIGRALAVLLKIDKWPLFATRPDAQRFAQLLLGAVVCALVLQIPGFGILPKIGTRFVGLLAVLGLGGIYRVSRSPLVEQ